MEGEGREGGRGMKGGRGRKGMKIGVGLIIILHPVHTVQEHSFYRNI